MSSTRQSSSRRRAQEREILSATRQLFDERGMREVQVEDVAKLAGINRAIIYRHFSGKEELFALTVERYLEELQERFDAVVLNRRTPATKLTAMVEACFDYGMEYPAFIDCSQSLMQRGSPELIEQVSEAALFRLGRATARCLRMIVTTLEEGTAAGDFTVKDANLLANYMYSSGLGAMQLARLGMLVKESAPGIPAISRVTHDQVRAFMVDTALALATR